MSTRLYSYPMGMEMRQNLILVEFAHANVNEFFLQEWV